MLWDFTNNLVCQILHCYLYYVILNRRVSSISCALAKVFGNNLISCFCTEVYKGKKISSILAIFIRTGFDMSTKRNICVPQVITLDTMLLRTLRLYSICAALEDSTTDAIASSL